MLNRESLIGGNNPAESDGANTPEANAWDGLSGNANNGAWISVVSPSGGEHSRSKVVSRESKLFDTMRRSIESDPLNGRSLHDSIEERRRQGNDEYSLRAETNLSYDFDASPEDLKLYGEYFTDKTEENLDFLEKNCPEMIDVYKAILEKEPMAGIIRIEQYHDEDGDDPYGAYFSNDSADGSSIYPCVSFPFDGIEHIGDDCSDADLVGMAESLGVRICDLRDNPRLLAEFVFAHEFGHGVEYLRDTLGDSLDSAMMMGIEYNLSYEECQTIAAREAINSSVIYRGAVIADYKDRGRTETGYTADTDSVERLAYRRESDEHYADTFSASLLLSDDLAGDRFTRFGEKKEPGKVESMIGGAYEVLPGSEFYTGLFSGTGVSVASLARKSESGQLKNVIRKESGFLSSPLVIGWPLELNKDGDYKKAQAVATRSSLRPVVRHIFCHPTFDKKKEVVNINYEITMSDDSSFLMRANGVEPEPVKCSVSEMFYDLGLDSGADAFVIQKRDYDSRWGDSMVRNVERDEDIFCGRPTLVSDGRFGRPGIKIEIDDGYTLELANIDSVYRRWDRYYVVNGISDYGSYEIYRIGKED